MAASSSSACAWRSLWPGWLYCFSRLLCASCNPHESVVRRARGRAANRTGAVMKAWLALWSAAQLRGMDNRGPTGNGCRDLSSATSGAWRSWRWRIEEALARPTKRSPALTYFSREVSDNAERSDADQGGAEVRPPARMLSWKASRRPTVSSRSSSRRRDGESVVSFAVA